MVKSAVTRILRPIQPSVGAAPNNRLSAWHDDHQHAIPRTTVGTSMCDRGCSLDLHPSRLYHLTPFLSFFADELGELRGRTRRKDCRAELGETGLDGRIG